MKSPIPAAALAQHVIALGKTGSGKSSKMRVIVEGLLEAGDPVCIVDPKGDWWGIKSSADGKRPGYPVVIFGGEHADVPLNPRAGAQLAELIATGNRPSLIDLGGWMVGERTRFWIDFASAFFRAARGARHLVIDEVHNFAPQGKVLDVDAGKALHWTNRIASEGRGKGITLIAASQRPQKVHKDFVTSCETLIACRVIHKLDRDAIKDWIDGCGDPVAGRQVLQDLAVMKREDAWCWSPEIGYGPERVSWPMFTTYDSFAPQKAGTAKLRGWADVDLAEVRGRLESLVKEAEANDPAKLKARIAELERAAKKSAAPVGASPAEIASAESRGMQAALAKMRKEVASTLYEGIVTIKRGHELLWKLLEQIDPADGTGKSIGWSPEGAAIADKVMRRRPGSNPPPPVGRKPAPPPSPPPRRETLVTYAKKVHVDGHFSRSQQTILDQLEVLEARGIYPAARATLAAFCKVSPSSSGYEKNLSTLKTAGLLDYPRQGEVAFTETGRQHASGAGDDGTPASTFWQSIVNDPKRLILQVLIDAHPRSLSREDVAVNAGVSPESSGFEKNLSTLRTLGAIDYPAPGTVALTRHVMP